MRHAALLCFLACTLCGAALAADERDTPATGGVKTAKERLTSKAADEQRVDDCKVPAAQRSRVRPTDCHTQ